GQQTLLQGVPPEDVTETGSDDNPEAVVHQCPNGVLPRRTGTELRARHKDARAGVSRIVEHEGGILPPGAEKPVLETGAADPLAINRRNDLISVHVGAPQWHSCSNVGRELLHLCLPYRSASRRSRPSARSAGPASRPTTAVAAATAGETRWVRPPLPW